MKKNCLIKKTEAINMSTFYLEQKYLIKKVIKSNNYLVI